MIRYEFVRSMGWTSSRHGFCLGMSAVLSLALMSACGGEDDAGQEPALDPTAGLYGKDTEGGRCVPLDQSLSTDYAPGEQDDWAACVSDDGEFHPIGSSISTTARAKAFDDIATRLFSPTHDLSPEAFLEARMIYDEDEGLGSRVARRYDPHHEAKSGTDCTVAADVKAESSYCAGPGRIVPIVQDAFAKGVKGEDPHFQAGRLEGALLWFFAISTYKESLSCTEKPEDCDSAYAYYDGAGAGYALGGYVGRVDPDADEAARVGALAVSCWRDLDPAIPAKDAQLRDEARTQLDRAVIWGTISVLLDRIDQARSATGADLRFHWGFIRTLLGALESQAWRDAGAEKVLAAAQTADAPTDLDELSAMLEGLSTCGG